MFWDKPGSICLRKLRLPGCRWSQTNLTQQWWLPHFKLMAGQGLPEFLLENPANSTGLTSFNSWSSLKMIKTTIKYCIWKALRPAKELLTGKPKLKLIVQNLLLLHNYIKLGKKSTVYKWTHMASQYKSVDKKFSHNCDWYKFIFNQYFEQFYSHSSDDYNRIKMCFYYWEV